MRWDVISHLCQNFEADLTGLPLRLFPNGYVLCDFIYVAGPFYSHAITLIPTRIGNYIHYNMRDKLIIHRWSLRMNYDNPQHTDVIDGINDSWTVWNHCFRMSRRHRSTTIKVLWILSRSPIKSAFDLKKTPRYTHDNVYLNILVALALIAT